VGWRRYGPGIASGRQKFSIGLLQFLAGLFDLKKKKINEYASRGIADLAAAARRKSPRKIPHEEFSKISALTNELARRTQPRPEKNQRSCRIDDDEMNSDDEPHDDDDERRRRLFFDDDECERG